MNVWPMDWAGRIADICSVLGLIVTVCLTAGALQVRSRFLKIILYPSYADKLSRQWEHLSLFLGKAAATADISRAIGQAKGELNSLNPYLKGNQKATLKKAVDRLDTYSTNRTDANLDAFLTVMYQLVTEMQNLSEGVKY